MIDEHQTPKDSDQQPDQPAQVKLHDMAASQSSNMARRTLLLGGLATGAAYSIKPAMAQAAASVLNCEIPIPRPGSANYINAEGEEVAPMTEGAYPPAMQPFTGEEVKSALNGQRLPRTSSSAQSEAYLNYIKNLKIGDSGYTCFVSIQQQPMR